MCKGSFSLKQLKDMNKTIFYKDREAVEIRIRYCAKTRFKIILPANRIILSL